jgi:dihydrofolate reductase
MSASVEGPSTIRQFLAADLIDHMHVVIVPVFLGRGERRTAVHTHHLVRPRRPRDRR